MITTPPRHHVGARTDAVDFQVWVAARATRCLSEPSSLRNTKKDNAVLGGVQELEPCSFHLSFPVRVYFFSRGGESTVLSTEGSMGTVQKKGGK